MFAYGDKTGVNGWSSISNNRKVSHASEIIISSCVRYYVKDTVYQFS